MLPLLCDEELADVIGRLEEHNCDKSQKKVSWLINNHFVLFIQNLHIVLQKSYDSENFSLNSASVWLGIL